MPRAAFSSAHAYVATRAEGPAVAHRANKGGAEQRSDAPVDMVHLARQSLGNRSLEVEILALFRAQSDLYLERIRHAADDKARSMAAHTLRGSALGIGAWQLAEEAAVLEKHPDRTALIDGFADTLDQTNRFIGALIDM
ncbi:Hpt domain-containing protein [Ahrensia sp. R2A130]|uniref:Hpt domain-containing protein n=1 Tax=Ahrensia sp. R2A130 TaxID=744979 RepID=UPI0001E0D0AB|nr:Hpt domain-containing protein [Ahrensia sp. R2A130]EFL90298.1 Hpt protein [Ahrensia sp. R2A130]